MDTDDLSREAYKGIIIEAELFTHKLTLHYGVLAGSCKNESDYLNKAEKLTMSILKAKDWELDDLFFGEIPDKNGLNKTCKNILDNIKKIREIPFDKRQFDF